MGLAFDLGTVSQADGNSQEIPAISAARCEPMSLIVDHLYIGSWRDMEEPAQLRGSGITHILNVAKEVDPAHHEDRLEGFKVLHIPLVDEHRENILPYMESACAFIADARTTHGKCLVHCRRGISRSPAIVVGYLMREHGHDFDSALQYVKERRTCVSLNIAFREFLSEYETPTMKRPEPSRAESSTFDDHDSHTHPTPGMASDGDGQCDSGASAHPLPADGGSPG